MPTTRSMTDHQTSASALITDFQGDGVLPSRRVAFSIRISIASAVVLSMLLVALVIITLGWQGARQTLLDTAAKTAADSGGLVTERTRRLLEPAQSTLRQISFDPIASSRRLEDRLARVFVFAEELAVNPLISAIYVGFDDGQFFLARPLDSEAMRDRFKAPASASFVVQSVSVAHGSQAHVGEHYFFDAENRIVERRRVPEYSFDPRTRPWFQSADNTRAQVLTEPYVFFTTRQIGLTLSQAVRGGGGVVGIDMVLDDLSSSLGDMRMTPSAELALIDAKGRILAYPEMSKVLVAESDRFDFKNVRDLNVPSVRQFAQMGAPLLEPRFFDVDGRNTLGMVLPFDVWPGQTLHLLATAPVDELLGDLQTKRDHVIILVVGMVILLLPLGWLAGSRLGHSLDRLSLQARRISAFDFGANHQPPSLVTEVNQLSSVMGEMSHTIQSFLDLSKLIASEPQVDTMLAKVLHQLVQATRCTGAAVYLWSDEQQRMVLAAVDGQDTLRFDDSFVYPAGRSPQTGSRKTISGDMQVELELRGRAGSLRGLLALVHPLGSGHADPAFVQFARQLSGMLAVSIETRELIEAQKNLLNAVIRLMADAIDAKSPYTGGHCERVPELATMLVDRLSAESSGPYATFHMSEEQRYEFYLGAWLHDCGKVTSPEHIVDKATKLEVIYNRIHEVRMRFEVLWRDAEIAHWQRVHGGADPEASARMLAERQHQLQDDFAFVAQCNVGGEFMADAAIDRLRNIAAQSWDRYFDDTLGLAAEEARRLALARPQVPDLPARELLLSDKPEHLVPWEGKRPAVERENPANTLGFDMVLPPHRQNMGEVYNLAIRRGTLTEEDRFKINDHIVQTYVMLKGLPWPESLRRVPEIAATHHEKMDGNGYPRKLPADRLTVADRVMALADIFEALTAADRPYKAPKTLMESLRIMAFMCKDRHIDSQLFRYFLHSGLWREFAQRYMSPEQIDVVDIAVIEQLLPAEAL